VPEQGGDLIVERRDGAEPVIHHDVRSSRRGPEAHVPAELLELRQLGGIALQASGGKAVAQRLLV
jgi:hypothetical protein